MTITQEELKRLVSYDPETGIITRKISTANRIKIGDVAGWIQISNGKSYIRMSISNRLHLAHRLAWLYITGSFPNGEIDHINGNGLDNRFCNLRDVIPNDNMLNKRIYQNNKSGMTGISWHNRDNIWSSQIGINGRRIHLGYSKNLFDAVCARKNAEIKYCFHKNHGSDRPL